MAFSAPKSGPCFSDPILLAIGRGEIREPALSHYLAHLEVCLACCKKSMDLVRDNPGPLLSLVPGVSRGEDEPGARPAWIDSLRAQLPRLRRSPLESETGPEVPPRFSHLEIQEVLGEGRAGVVYRATDTQLGRQVALKVLRPDIAKRPGMAESFLREAQALAKVRNPHVVLVHAFGLEPLPHIVMEFLEGQTLAKALANGPMAPDRAISLIRDVASGLAALHDAGLVHRDIKPVNVGLRLGPDGEQAVLLDLGLVAEGDLNAGTPGYMAPELTGQVLPNTAADIYSLGVLLRVLALGGDGGDLAKGNPHPSLMPLINHMMADNPEDRPSAYQVTLLARDWLERPARTRRRLLAGAGGLALLGFLGFTWWTRGQDKISDTDPLSRVDFPVNGKPPDKVLPGLFSPEVASAQVEFHFHDGFYYLLTGMSLQRVSADGKDKQAFSVPFQLDKTSLVGNLLAISSAYGDVEVWDLSQWPPSKIATYKVQNGSFLSVSLAPDFSGDLLVVEREKVLVAKTDKGKFPSDLEIFKEPAFYSNMLPPVSLYWGTAPGTVLGFQSRGGVTLHRLSREYELIWAFRPFAEGPAFYCPRPDLPGCLVLASPRGEVGFFGPAIEKDPGQVPHPAVGWGVKLGGRIAGLAFPNRDFLVAHTTVAPSPLKFTDVNSNGAGWSDLHCPSPVAIQGHPPTGTLHVLTSKGDVEIWRFDSPKPD